MANATDVDLCTVAAPPFGPQSPPLLVVPGSISPPPHLNASDNLVKGGNFGSPTHHSHPPYFLSHVPSNSGFECFTFPCNVHTPQISHRVGPSAFRKKRPSFDRENLPSFFRYRVREKSPDTRFATMHRVLRMQIRSLPHPPATGEAPAGPVLFLDTNLPLTPPRY